MKGLKLRKRVRNRYADVCATRVDQYRNYERQDAGKAAPRSNSHCVAYLPVLKGRRGDVPRVGRAGLRRCIVPLYDFRLKLPRSQPFAALRPSPDLPLCAFSASLGITLFSEDA